MPTQREIATHLCMDESTASRWVAHLGVDWRNVGMDVIREAYILELRGRASGHTGQDGSDLTRERAMTERVDRRLKELKLAELEGQLVNLEQLEPALARVFDAFRTELMARDDKLKTELDALYGVDVDLALITEHTRNALEQLARYQDSMP